MRWHELLCLMVAGLCACNTQAQNATQAPSGGWSGRILSNVTLQKSSEDALRSRPSPFRADLVTDTGGRLQNLFALQFKRGDWTFQGAYADNRTLGGGNAYSLTNPMVFGVNTVETTGARHQAVDDKSGLHELAASYCQNSTVVMVGKIDTSNWYLADPVFGGDLTNGNDFANAATRVVAPPFPSLALVIKHDHGNGLSLTGIAGDAFGDRETLYAARNLVKGDLAYVVELNYQNPTQHLQLTFNHIDAFRYLDKDAVWPVAGQKLPEIDAVMATASHRFNPHWAGFTRFSVAKGAGQLEDRNHLVGVRFDGGQFSALVSHSSTRVGTDSTPYLRGAKGDRTAVGELTLNYTFYPQVTFGMTFNLYRSSGRTLLAKDGGWNGARRNQIVGLRVTSIMTF